MSSAPEAQTPQQQQQQNQQQQQGRSAAPPPSGKLSFDEISKFFNLPIAEAASLLGVCTSVLKRLCRENGIIRWPYRKFLAGKTVEEIKKDAAKEKTRELADLSKIDRQRVDVTKMMPSTTVGLSSTFGNQLQSRNTGIAQETSKLQGGVSMPGSGLWQSQGNKFLQHGSPNMVQSNQTRNIPTYLDDFKYGFPAKGLSSVSTKWWGSSSKEGTENSKEEEKQELTNETARCMLIDEPAGSNKNDSIINVPSASLLSVRKQAVESGRDSLKVGISKGCESYKLGKRQRLVLLQVFKSSYPDQWKEKIS